MLTGNYYWNKLVCLYVKFDPGLSTTHYEEKMKRTLPHTKHSVQHLFFSFCIPLFDYVNLIRCETTRIKWELSKSITTRKEVAYWFQYRFGPICRLSTVTSTGSTAPTQTFTYSGVQRRSLQQLHLPTFAAPHWQRRSPLRHRNRYPHDGDFGESRRHRWWHFLTIITKYFVVWYSGTLRRMHIFVCFPVSERYTLAVVFVYRKYWCWTDLDQNNHCVCLPLFSFP